VIQTVDTPSVFIANLWRVVFRRGSPERILYTRRRFIIGLFAAIAACGLVHAFYYQDHLVFVILRIFAELTTFMMAMVILTAKIPRFRLAYLMLVLVLISVSMDTILIVLAALLAGVMQVAPELEGATLRTYMGLAVALPMLYGASSCVAWGLRKPWSQGAIVMAAYVAVATGIDLAFRGLYGIMAAT